MGNFIDRLRDTINAKDSLLCVGLDVDPDRVPEPLRGRSDWVYRFNVGIIEATSDLVCAYKPNLGFYEAMGVEGMEALARSLKAMPEGVLVIGDAKRGDIGHTARAYAQGLFGYFGFDAITASPYLGRDSIEPFLAYEDRGVFRSLQDLQPWIGGPTGSGVSRAGG